MPESSKIKKLIGGVIMNNQFDDGLTVLRQNIYEANREAARFYGELLYKPEGKEQLSYLRKRAISDPIIARFGLGAAPDANRALYNRLHEAGYDDEALISADLVRRSEEDGQIDYYDNLRNKIIYPIVDVDGNIVAFGSRGIGNSNPKYTSPSDTPVYAKNNELYALNLAKDNTDGTLILCEGYMDVIALHAAGFTNAVAGLGIVLTAGQVSLISRYAKAIFLCYDSDEAGQRAAQNALSLFAETDVKVKVIMFDGMDPESFLCEQGKERFKALLDGTGSGAD